MDGKSHLYLKFIKSMAREHYDFAVNPVDLGPYDFHLRQSAKSSKSDLLWEDDLYVKLLSSIEENELYIESGEKFCVTIESHDELRLSQIALNIYNNGDIERKIRTLQDFFKNHRQSVEDDLTEFIAGHGVKPPGRKKFDEYIEGLVDVMLTKEDIRENILKWLFEDAKISPITRRTILEFLYGQHDWRSKDNRNEYDRAIAKFKGSIVNTAHLKILNVHQGMADDNTCTSSM
ncbi:hypothetical protein QAD02_013365 [Eretmocerus hayati]|uniref:Uncharacterized protein n=1 Tax=Eretmocerus hayati TaxID=131215 RepID=A0ACC2P391_9HYME|nr:hypothetical protein QAD02_013365 [Eretmocerus hayati]